MPATPDPTTTPAAPAADPGCRDEPRALAWLSCDESVIVVRDALDIDPHRSVLAQRHGATLDAVARLMRKRQDLLMLRIEAYSSVAADADPARRRQAVDQSQRRADRVFHDLWKRGGVWAERLDAVGYGYDARFAGAASRYPIVLRIVQRRRRAPPTAIR